MSELNHAIVVPTPDELAAVAVRAPGLEAQVAHLGRAHATGPGLHTAGLDLLNRVLIALRRDRGIRQRQVVLGNGARLSVLPGDPPAYGAIVLFHGRSDDGSGWLLSFDGEVCCGITVVGSARPDDVALGPAELLDAVSAAFPGIDLGAEITRGTRSTVVGRLGAGADALPTDHPSERFWPLLPDRLRIPPGVRCDAIVRVTHGPARPRGNDVLFAEDLRLIREEAGPGAAQELRRVRRVVDALRDGLRAETGRGDILAEPSGPLTTQRGWAFDLAAPVPATHPAARHLHAVGPDHTVAIGWRIAFAAPEPRDDH